MRARKTARIENGVLAPDKVERAREVLRQVAANGLETIRLSFADQHGLLRGKTIVNLFFEASTRTRTTFELAAKRLSADVLNINISASSAVKGETLLDTLRNLEAMHVDSFVVRHAHSDVLTLPTASRR